MNEIAAHYLTKVTDRQWAERLLDGELYMRPLSHFGDLLDRPVEAANTYRGDIFEGAVAVTCTCGFGSTFVKEAFGDSFPVDGHVVWLSESANQHRIYSLYCFEYSTKFSAFVSPDTRLREFGDTAVLIINPIEFFARLRQGLTERSIPLSVCAARRVNYVMDSSTCGEYDEFAKSPSYSWQNEYRLSIDLSMGQLDQKAWHNMSDLTKIMFLNQGGEPDLASFGIVSADVSRTRWEAMSVLSKVQFLAERSRAEPKPVVREPLTLHLGSLRDICVSISTTDLVALKLPVDKFHHGPYVVPPLHRQATNTGGRSGL